MNQLATSDRRSMSKFETLSHQLDKMVPEFQAVLPPTLRVDEFKRVVMTAIRENEDLVEAEQSSFFKACLECARDGLVPDGKEAYFDIRSTKVGRGDNERWVKKVVYMPMIGGFLKRTIGVTLQDWRGDVVREGDFYDLEKGDKEHFIHKPDPFAGDDRRIVGAYSVAINLDGSISREFMSLADIEKVRSKSSSAHSNMSPWNQWFDRMAIKSVMKRHSKRLKLSADAQDLVRRDLEADALEALPASRKAAAPAIANKAAVRQLQELAAPEERQEAREDTRQPEPAPGQQQEAPAAPKRRGPGRPSNQEREAAQQATQEMMQEEMARRAQPAAENRAPTNSPPSSAPNSKPAQTGPAQTASRSRQPEPEPDNYPDQGEDVEDDANEMSGPEQAAWQSGYSTYHAGAPRKPPRELTAANRYDELSAWFDGWDSGEEEHEKANDENAAKTFS